MMLWRWVIREHFVSGAYLKMYLSDCLQILHTTQQLCLLGHMNFDPLLVQYYDLFRRFDTHLVSGADLETTGPIRVILHIHALN